MSDRFDLIDFKNKAFSLNKNAKRRSPHGKDVGRINANQLYDLWMNSRGCCSSCGSKNKITIDHIAPLSMGGFNTIKNLQLLCYSCNQKKGASISLKASLALKSKIRGMQKHKEARKLAKKNKKQRKRELFAMLNY